MGFLNPLWLVGMSSAAIPLIIHLIGRRRESRVDFSSLRLLREVDRRRSLWVRLRRLLLLIIRMAICAGVFLALARPVVNFTFGGLTHAPTAACLVIDDSPSMEADGGQTFREAKGHALEIVEHFDERDELFVLTTSGGAEVGPSNERSVVEDFISNLETSWRVAHLAVSLDRAKSLLGASTKINKVIYLISDLQAINFEELENVEVENLTVVDVGKELENVGVTNVGTGELLSPKGSSRTNVTVANFSSRDVKARIGVWLEGEKTRVAEADLSHGSDLILEVDIPIEDAGYHSGYVQLMEDDRLMADNVRYFTLQVPGEIPVLVISEDETEGMYLVKALRPKPDVGTPFAPELISPKEILRKDVLSYDVVVLNDVDKLDFGELKILQKYFEDGGRACLFLGERIDANFYNMAIISEFQAHVDTFVRLPQPSFVSVSRVESTHPIFSAFREKKFGDLSLSRFYGYHPVETLPGQTIAWFSNGKPAIVESPERGILFASSPGQSDIVKKAIFVPLIHKLFYYLAKKQEVLQGVLVGERFKMETPEALRSVVCVTPQEEEVQIIPKVLGGQTVIAFSETDEPGIYRLEADGNSIGLFAVNIDPRESETRKLAPEELSEVFGSHALRGADNRDPGLGLHTFELTKSILWVILGLVLVELLVERRR